MRKGRSCRPRCEGEEREEVHSGVGEGEAVILFIALLTGAAVFLGCSQVARGELSAAGFSFAVAVFNTLLALDVIATGIK